MAYTSHGHHIEGSPKGVAPARRARCGGPKLCPICGQEERSWKVANSMPPPKPLNPMDVEDEQRRLDIAARARIMTSWGVHVTPTIFEELCKGLE